MESNASHQNEEVKTPEPNQNDRKFTKKRTDYMEWEEYFMAIAFLVAKRSKDPSTRVGACIVNNDNRIVAQGYNGMPRGCSDKDFPWNKTSDDPLENKYLYVCHAEMNAILNKNCAELKGCRIYTVLFPCNECAKMIIQTGITEVIYASGKNMNKNEGLASVRMFNASGVKYRQFIPKESKVIIDFNEIVLHASELPPTPVKRN